MERVAVLGLGANLGDPLRQIRRASASLGVHLGDLSVSSVFRSAPEHGADQPDYLNAVVRGTWPGAAGELLSLAHRLESEAGRERPHPGAARTLDVDVIFLGDVVLTEGDLRIPHPRWRSRPFVVVPLLELDPEWRDPETGQTVRDVARAGGWAKNSLERVAEIR